MNRRNLAIAVLLLVACTAARAQKVQNEGLVRELGPGWTAMYEISKDARYNLIELIPHGYNFNNWTEVVRISDFTGASDRSAEDTLAEEQKAGERHCPGSMHWRVISKDEKGVMFQWHSDVCGRVPEEDAVGRLIVGRYSRYLLEYSARVHELTPETRAKWMKTFSDASFDFVTVCFDSEWMSVDVDESVAYPMDKVMDALEISMQTHNCHISEKTGERIECKRPRLLTGTQAYDLGGESVTGFLEAAGTATHIRITTGKGFYGRLAKKNWSTPIFEAMMTELQREQK